MHNHTGAAKLFYVRESKEPINFITDIELGNAGMAGYLRKTHTSA